MILSNKWMSWYLFGHSHKWSEFQLLSECLSQLLYSQWFLYILLLYVHFSEVFIIYNIYPTVFENLCFSFVTILFLQLLNRLLPTILTTTQCIYLSCAFCLLCQFSECIESMTNPKALLLSQPHFECTSTVVSAAIFRPLSELQKPLKCVDLVKCVTFIIDLM